MITKDQYELIRTKHGEYCSWAVWADSIGKPKSNMGVIEHFDDPDIIHQLNNKVIMVALNFSRAINPVPFINFHDSNPRAHDYKIRYTFRGTRYWGAYMTDVIKRYVDVDSSQVVKHLNKNPDVVTKNLDIFREELADLKADRPIILAFGVDTHRLLKSGLKTSEYSHLVKLTHYSHQIGQEEYKKESLEKLSILT
jgi:hypothetical protein